MEEMQENDEKRVSLFTKKKGNNISFRPSDLIEARYKLSSKENDVIDILLTKIQEDNKLRYNLNLTEYINYYNIENKNNLYVEYKKIIKGFEGKGVHIINSSDNTETYYTWFTKIKYVNTEARIEIDLHPEMKAMLLQAKRGIFYDLKYTLRLENEYAKRYYYYCKSYVDTKWRSDRIEDLYYKLECPKSYRDNYARFRRYVLTIARDQINKYSDIIVDFSEEYTGKKVTQIKTSIKKKTQEELKNINIELEKLEIKKEKIDFNNDEPIRIRILNSIKPYENLIKDVFLNGKNIEEAKQLGEIKAKLAEEYVISIRTLNRYISININLIDEFKELFDKNFISVVAADSFSKFPAVLQYKEFEKFKKSLSNIRKSLCSQLGDLLDEYKISYAVAEKYSKKSINEQIYYYNKNLNKNVVIDVEYKELEEDQMSIDFGNQIAPAIEGNPETIKGIIKDAIGLEINDSSAMEIYKCAKNHKEYGNSPLELIKEVAEYSTTQNIKNGYVGWFKSTVENYERPLKYKPNKTNIYNNHKQKQYDIKSIERALLGWDKDDN